jgi:hypothetical protein
VYCHIEKFSLYLKEITQDGMEGGKEWRGRDSEGAIGGGSKEEERERERERLSFGI